MKIVADKNIPFLKGVLEPFAEMVYLPGNTIKNEDIKDADALIIRTRTKCNEKLLKNTKVRCIASATIGYDHIDTAYCSDNGIQWFNAPGCNSGSVQQYMASALLELSNKKLGSLEGKTLGIVGVGNVGSKIEKIAHIFGMKVLLNDPPRERREGKEKFVSLDEVLQSADIITLHVPLSYEGADKTYHMINSDTINNIPEKTYIINTSRGEVVDNKALLYALKRRQLSGTVLDVWENEPNLNLDLLNMVDIGTPHIAGYSLDGKANGTAMCVQAISKVFDLGLNEWYPSHIPKPANSSIEINSIGKSDKDILKQAVLATYSIYDDDQKLRDIPGNFENIRNNYPARREFNAYKVRLIDSNQDITNKLENIGFEVIYG